MFQFSWLPSERTKLRLILRGKRLGLSLDESAEIVLMYGSPRNNRKQLEKLLARIQEKKVELKSQQRDLEFMLLDLGDAEEKCLKTLEEMASRKILREKT